MIEHVLYETAVGRVEEVVEGGLLAVDEGVNVVQSRVVLSGADAETAIVNGQVEEGRGPGFDDK